MADVLWFLFSAGGVVAAFAIAAASLIAAPRSRLALRFVFAVAAVYAVMSSWAVSHSVTGLLASGYQPLTRSAVPVRRTAIVLLGSGIVQVRDWSENRFVTLDRHSAARTLEAARVFRLLDPVLVISSGGDARSKGIRPSGRVMADELVRLGVPSERILIEAESKTTRDETVLLKAMLDSRGIEQVVLVTSSAHMRRSVGAFRAVGLQVIPAVARDTASVDTWWEAILPSDSGLDEAAMAAHEVLGLLWYLARGWYRF